MASLGFIQYINKYRFFILSILFIIGLYFFLRLYDLTSLPLFIDEVSYVRWGILAQTDATQRFISLTDGKQPLFVWIMWPLVKVFSDPVVAGRMVSVVSGFLTIVGLFCLTKVLFKRNAIAVVTSFIYLLVPMTLLYDRLALYDSLVASLTVWSLFFLVLLVRLVRLDVAILLGYVFGLGLLTKSSIQLVMVLSPVALLLSPGLTKKRLLRLGGLFFVSIIIAFFIAQIMRLSSYHHMIGTKNTVFVYSLSEILQNPPLGVWFTNIHDLSAWFVSYMTLPILLIGILSFVLIKRDTKEKLFLLLMSILPLLSVVVLGKLIYPRYILFMLVTFLPLAGYGIWALYSQIEKKMISLALIFLIFLPSIYIDGFILKDMPNAPIPQADSLQFANSWPSGYGMMDVIRFIDARSQEGTVYLATEGLYGSLPTTLAAIYLEHNHEVVRFPIDHPLPKKLPQELMWQAEKHPVYIVLNIEQQAPSTWPVQLVERYRKGKGEYYLSLYQLKLPSSPSEK